jgi:ArsR family transcriptional regulator
MSTARDSRLTTIEAAFKAFADPTRLRILGLLAGGEICVCNIHECLGIPQPTASRHLAYLRKKGLVLARKEGLWVHYTLAPLDEPVMRVLLNAVTHVICHCDSIRDDRRRLESQTGCCARPIAAASFDCCAPMRMPTVSSSGAKNVKEAERRRERRKDRRRANS